MAPNTDPTDPDLWGRWGWGWSPCGLAEAFFEDDEIWKHFQDLMLDAGWGWLGHATAQNSLTNQRPLVRTASDWGQFGPQMPVVHPRWQFYFGWLWQTSPCSGLCNSPALTVLLRGFALAHFVVAKVLIKILVHPPSSNLPGTSIVHSSEINHNMATHKTFPIHIGIWGLFAPDEGFPL
jgi:hypothetical protein